MFQKTHNLCIFYVAVMLLFKYNSIDCPKKSTLDLNESIKIKNKISNILRENNLVLFVLEYIEKNLIKMN